MPLLVAATAVAQLTTAASAAAAISAPERTEAPSDLDNSPSKHQEASCQAPKRVIGGGARISGSTDPRISIHAMYPAASGARFYVEAGAPGGVNVGSWRLTAYAVCAEVSGTYQVATRESARNTSRFKHVEAVCAGAATIGGGVEVHFADSVPIAGRIGIQLSRSDGPMTIWRGTAHVNGNASYNFAWSVMSYAICVQPVTATYVFSGNNVDASCASLRVHSPGGGGATEVDLGAAVLRAVEPLTGLRAVHAEFNAPYPDGAAAVAICR